MFLKFNTLLLKIIIKSLLVGFILFLFNPLYTTVNLSRALRHIRLNEVAPIQIIPHDADLKVLNTSGDLDIDPQKAPSIHIPISKEWKTQSIDIQVLTSGKISLVLQGAEKFEDNKNYLIPVEYHALKVDGKDIFTNTLRLVGTEHYTIDDIFVQKGKPFQIKLETKKGKLKLLELNQILGIKPFRFLLAFTISLCLAFIVVYFLKRVFLKLSLPFSTFFFCFFTIIALILPTLVIDKSKATYQENRLLASFPSFLKEGKLNMQFGPELDAWFNDRFWGRKKLIRLYTKASYLNTIIRNTQASYNKKTGWMFGTETFFNPTPEEQTTIIESLNSLDRFCQKNGIKLYVLLVPLKETIYKEKFYNQFPGKTDITGLEKEHLERIEPILSALNHGRVVYPYRELLQKSEQDYVFYKESHHWTDDGAFIGCQKLISVMKQDFPQITEQDLSEYRISYSNKIRDSFERDYNTGDTARLLNISPKYSEKNILKTPYIYYDNKRDLDLKIMDIPFYRTKHFINKNSQNSYRVFLSGFSQNDSLIQFLPYAFKELIFYRLNNVKEVKTEDNAKFIKRYKQDLLDFKPDILILTISPSQLLESGLFKE